MARSRYGAGHAGGLTATIVRLVADVEGVAPREVTDPPLYEVVDPEALERAYSPRGRGSRAVGDVDSTEFTYRGHRVVVRADGWVEVGQRTDG